MPVDDDGHFSKVTVRAPGPFSGMEVTEANPVIVQRLKDRGTLILRARLPTKLSTLLAL